MPANIYTKAVLTVIVVALSVVVWNNQTFTPAQAETLRLEWDAAPPDKPMSDFTEDEALYWECGVSAVASWGSGDEQGEVALICYDRYSYALSFVPPHFPGSGSLSVALSVGGLPMRTEGALASLALPLSLEGGMCWWSAQIDSRLVEKIVQAKIFSLAPEGSDDEGESFDFELSDSGQEPITITPTDGLILQFLSESSARQSCSSSQTNASQW